MDKLKQLSITELYTILTFLREEVVRVENEDEREIYNTRINVIEDEIKQIINNLF